MARIPPMTPTRRLRWTALLFLVALVFLVIASLTHEVWPLFVGWLPLLAVPWMLTRPEVIRDEAPRSASVPEDDPAPAGDPSHD
jgi:hypothetical protein